jgi:amidophosphoribosyltransferase
LGELANGEPVLASETCALDALGARFVRSVANGEVLVISRGEGGKAQVRSVRAFPEMPERPCVFEYIYFARPNSVMGGRSIYDIRHRFGERLARERPASADIVVPVLDSGLPAALGFAKTSGLALEMGIVRSPYVQRTFIAPRQEIRQLKVRMKHTADRMVLKGRRVVLVDDSVVRGTTSRQIVQMVRDAGAREVHFRVASPMIKHPDFYGIDMPTREELIAHKLKSEAEIGRELGADSIGFLSIDGLYWGLGERERRSDYPQFADHCFTGDYPVPLPDRDADRAGKEYQLSLLSDLP